MPRKYSILNSHFFPDFYLLFSQTSLLFLQIFDNFRETGNTRIFEKIVVVPGDILLPELGLSEMDKERLKNEVSIVFFGSALLKMDASLKEAVDVNMLGVIRAIDLAQKMKNLIVSILYLF